MIHLKSDWSEIDRELDRVSNMPTPKMIAILDAAHGFGFLETQAAVHIETGALKASGKSKTKTLKTSRDWEGEIEYGGAASSVDYAWYEQRRGVHWVGPSSVKGDHDFMSPVNGPEFTEVMVKALLEGLEG